MKALSLLLLFASLIPSLAIVHFQDVQTGNIHAVDMDPSQLSPFDTYSLMLQDAQGNLYSMGVDASGYEAKEEEEFDINQFGFGGLGGGLGGGAGLKKLLLMGAAGGIGGFGGHGGKGGPGKKGGFGGGGIPIVVMPTTNVVPIPVGNAAPSPEPSPEPEPEPEPEQEPAQVRPIVNNYYVKKAQPQKAMIQPVKQPIVQPVVQQPILQPLVQQPIVQKMTAQPLHQWATNVVQPATTKKFV